MAETKAAEIPVNQIDGPKLSVGTYKGVRVLKDVSTVLVEFTDRDGLKQTKLAIIIGGTDVRFIADGALSGQVQKWLSDSVLLAAGFTPPKGG